MGQLILSKIIKTIVIRCQILRLKCTIIDFGWGSAPRPRWEITALPRPQARIKGEEGEEREVNAREAKGREGREWSEGDSRVHL